MAHESQDVDDKMWPPHIEQTFIEIMLDEQVKGNMENGVFKMSVLGIYYQATQYPNWEEFAHSKGDSKAY